MRLKRVALIMILVMSGMPLLALPSSDARVAEMSNLFVQALGDNATFAAELLPVVKQKDRFDLLKGLLGIAKNAIENNDTDTKALIKSAMESLIESSGKIVAASIIVDKWLNNPNDSSKRGTKEELKKAVEELKIAAVWAKAAYEVIKAKEEKHVKDFSDIFSASPYYDDLAQDPNDILSKLGAISRTDTAALAKFAGEGGKQLSDSMGKVSAVLKDALASNNLKKHGEFVNQLFTSLAKEVSSLYDVIKPEKALELARDPGKSLDSISEKIKNIKLSTVALNNLIKSKPELRDLSASNNVMGKINSAMLQLFPAVIRFVQVPAAVTPVAVQENTGQPGPEKPSEQKFARRGDKNNGIEDMPPFISQILGGTGATFIQEDAKTLEMFERYLRQGPKYIKQAGLEDVYKFIEGKLAMYNELLNSTTMSPDLVKASATEIHKKRAQGLLENEKEVLDTALKNVLERLAEKLELGPDKEEIMRAIASFTSSFYVNMPQLAQAPRLFVFIVKSIKDGNVDMGQCNNLAGNPAEAMAVNAVIRSAGANTCEDFARCIINASGNSSIYRAATTLVNNAGENSTNLNTLIGFLGKNVDTLINYRDLKSPIQNSLNAVMSGNSGNTAFFISVTETPLTSRGATDHNRGTNKAKKATLKKVLAEINRRRDAAAKPAAAATTATTTARGMVPA